MERLVKYAIFTGHQGTEIYRITSTIKDNFLSYIIFYFMVNDFKTCFRGSHSGGSQDSDCVTEYSTTSTIGYSRGNSINKPGTLQKFDEKFRYKCLEMRYKDKSEFI